MGDISAEPSMEEILSSIKRIIAEEGEGPSRRRASRTPDERAQAPALRSAPPGPEAEDEVLELSDPIPAASAPHAEPTLSRPEEDPVREAVPVAAARMAQPAGPVIGSAPEPILSAAATDATRGALESLSRLMVKPEPHSDGTLEGLVRDMLRPMLRDWLDAHLPEMVEAMVSREIARISGQPR